MHQNGARDSEDGAEMSIDDVQLVELDVSHPTDLAALPFDEPVTVLDGVGGLDGAVGEGRHDRCLRSAVAVGHDRLGLDIAVLAVVDHAVGVDELDTGRRRPGRPRRWRTKAP